MRWIGRELTQGVSLLLEGESVFSFGSLFEFVLGYDRAREGGDGLRLREIMNGCLLTVSQRAVLVP